MRKRLTYMALGALMGVTASAVTATAADTITSASPPPRPAASRRSTDR